ncbi:MAG: purine-nucleoside phosphorylase [Arenicella sp.]|jgi:purine-nucleoside phosphorylase
MTLLVESVASAVNSIRKQYAQNIDCAIILGSGLSELSLDGFATVARIDYADIDGLPLATAPSHKGQISIISNGTKTIALCAGRHHLYEGYTAQQVTTLVYTLEQLGAGELIITNAAGALNPDFQPGDVMIIEDHINFTGHNPVRGQDQSFGVLFPDMSKAYNPQRVVQASAAAEKQQVNFHQGIYIGVLGPSLETSAERRMMRGFGADAVGMSTVLESIAANHCGMQVLGLSAITNLALGNEEQQADTIEEVLENAAIAGQGMKKILNEILS